MKLVFCCLLACASVLRAKECNPEETARTILEREAQFLRLGQEEGTRAASLEFLAEDAIAFEPGPVNARKLWAGRTENLVSLLWKPLFVAVARSCDLAYTTGPFNWRKNKTDAEPLGYGQYATLWEKQKEGTWKIVADISVPVPGARKSEEPAEAVIDPGVPESADPVGAPKRLRQAEKWFAETAATDSTAALIGASSEDVRVFRAGVFPAIGRAPATLMLSVRRGKLKVERLGGAISRANDLAFSYGKYSLDLPQQAENGYYLQIWRTDAQGAWKVVLDQQMPLPAAVKKG